MTPTLRHRGPNTHILRRSPDWNNEEFLYHIYNDLGYRGLRIAHNYEDEQGEMRFSKWIDYNTIMHTGKDERITGTYMTRSEFVEKATHRTILDIEVMMDVDEPAPGCDTIKETTIQICQTLKKHDIPFVVHWTGNKSYHVSFLYPELRQKNRRTREKIVSWIVSDTFHADAMKVSDNQMIALEGAPHYRSGEPKQEVFYYDGIKARD